MGSSKVGACEECTLKCLMVHGRKNSSPTVTSFFKIILGDNISKALHIPPSFAKTIMSLVDEKTYLEDSTGQRWKVNIRNLGGSIAFQQGWHEFASDHCLEFGDFVVCNYISGSHFVVQVYGRSGCEKRNFSKKNNSRGRPAKIPFSLPSDGKNSNSTEKLSPMINKSSRNEQGSCSTSHLDSDAEIIESRCNVQDVKKVPLSAEKTSHVGDSNAGSKPVLPKNYDEVPFYMFDRNCAVEQGASRTSVFDLSDFEMLGNKSGDDRINKLPVVTEKEESLHSNVNTVQPETTQGTHDIKQRCNTLDKRPENKARGRRGDPLDISDFEMPARDCGNAKNAYVAPLAKDKISTSKSKDKVTGNGDKSKETLRKYPSSAFPKTVDLSMKTAPPGFSTAVLPEQRNRMYPDLVGKGSIPVEKDSVFQTKNNPLSRSPESFTKFAGEMSGCHKDPTMKGINVSGKKLKVFKEQVERVQEKHGKKPVAVKLEPEERINPVEVKAQARKVVKTENIELNDSSSFNLVDFRCPVSRDDQLVLEVPTNLPAFSSRGKMRMERKIVLLRDPAMRLWPVLFHERAGFRVLSSGWEALAKANNIRKGDNLVFEVENESECMFRVRIARE